MVNIDNDLQSLIGGLGRTLRDEMKTVATAEHGTSGLLAYMLSSDPITASVFRRGFVCNDQRGLVEEVGVQRATVETYGLLSQAVAQEMARGARFNSDCTYGIALVANAGPCTAEEVKAGMVWVAVSHGTSFSNNHHQIDAGPQEIRWQTATSGLMLLAEAIKYF